MLIIRLRRVGKAKKASYRFIISEKARDTKGDYLEELGTFDPHAKEGGLKIKTERVKYWLDKGTQLSDTVHNLFLSAGLIPGKKRRSVYLTERRKKKIAEKKGAAASAAEATAAKAAKVEAPAAPAETAPAPAEVATPAPVVVAPAETPAAVAEPTPTPAAEAAPAVAPTETTPPAQA